MFHVETFECVCVCMRKRGAAAAVVYVRAYSDGGVKWPKLCAPVEKGNYSVAAFVSARPET